MRILVDTNIILRLAQPGHSQRPEIVEAIASLNSAKHEICVVPQVFFEYWVVATRPVENNGLGTSVPDVQASIELLLQDLVLLPDPTNLFSNWLELVSLYDVKGRTAHDARLVAAMKCHAIDVMLTFNTSDFARYSSITAISPADHQSLSKLTR
jgi:predicted nucleic acid-binding protein